MTRRARRRRVELWPVPDVEPDGYRGRVALRFRGTSGALQISGVAHLDPSDAAALVRELRRALRTIRTQQAQRLDSAISYAEMPL